MDHLVTIHKGEKTKMTFVKCSCGYNLHGTGTAQMAEIAAEHYTQNAEV